MAHSVFGIRHHGPGSARSLVQALHTLQPDCVLIEGPPDADALLPMAIAVGMQPPVALLIYAPDEPKQAVYYPFAVFSPEWQAIQFALNNHIAVRFMDLPVSVQLARSKGLEVSESPETPNPSAEETADQTVRADPLSLLAQAAGYSDSERWWEHMVEERHDSTEVFQAILEAMSALRHELDAHHPRPTLEQEREQWREAHMRKTIRQAQKEGFERIAVVCGAWHAPALQALGSAKADDVLLKGLTKLKTAATWIPWTHERLSSSSGYGAGVEFPGWYAHMWNEPKQLTTRWLTQVAITFRTQSLDISSAHIIESVRLAETLAAMRERPVPSLVELNEAVQSVMLFGDTKPMALLRNTLFIGETLGSVPDTAPQTPLQLDLAQQQKRLRLQPAASDTELLLDLRKPTDLERSYVLRRLKLLGIPWGGGGERARGKGTFKESWRLQWQPEFMIRLIEAGLWGNTVEEASAHYVSKTAQDTTSLATLAHLAQDALYANLPDVVDVLMQRLQVEAAVSHDLLPLMQALPELAQLLRYGDVRNTSVAQVASVVQGMVTRICIGLPNACSSLNEAAAEAMFNHIQATQEALTLLDNAEFIQQWHTTLQHLMEQLGLQALLAGRCCRLLLQAGFVSEEETARRLGLAVSVANEPMQAGAWVDGFLRGSGQLLIYDEVLWSLIDTWVTGLTPEAFQQLLPVLRRTFATFAAPERRQMGERVKQGQGSVRETAANDEFNQERGMKALPIVAQLLGLMH